jgi:hypothetical protein
MGGVSKKRVNVMATGKFLPWLAKKGNEVSRVSDAALAAAGYSDVSARFAGSSAALSVKRRTLATSRSEARPEGDAALLNSVVTDVWQPHQKNQHGDPLDYRRTWHHAIYSAERK